jgi:hypothetical protein
MNRDHGPSSEGRRIVGLCLALGATFGAAAGAAIGAASGDVGHWMGMGIPFGITIGLAAGALFSKPSRRGPLSQSGTTPWTAGEDDSPAQPPVRAQDRSQPERPAA